MQLLGIASEVSVTVFPRTYAECREALVPDALVVVDGRLERSERTTADGQEYGELKILASSVKPLDDARRPSRKRREAADQGREEMARQRAQRQCVKIDLGRVPLGDDAFRQSLLRLREILAHHPGASPVLLNVREPEGPRSVLLPEPFTVEFSPGLAQEVAHLLGEGCIRAESA
jgi:DNA polymerase III alpha subunit